MITATLNAGIIQSKGDSADMRLAVHTTGRDIAEALAFLFVGNTVVYQSVAPIYG